MLRSIFGIIVWLGLLINMTDTWAFPIIGGTENITINGDMPYLHLRDTAKAVLQQGAQVAYLSAADNAQVILEAGAEVAYLTASHHTVLRSVGGSIGFLTVEGNSQIHIHHLTLKDGTYAVPGVSSGDGAIAYTPDTMIHLYADNVAFNALRCGKVDIRTL